MPKGNQAGWTQAQNTKQKAVASDGVKNVSPGDVQEAVAPGAGDCTVYILLGDCISN